MKRYIIIGIIAIFIISVAAITLSNQGNSSTATPTPTETSTPVSLCLPTTSPTTMPTATTNMADPADVASATQVALCTTMGDITLDLYPDAAPLAVKNFVTLGKRGYYNGDIFHRVIKNFMIQSGDPTGTGSGGESIYGQTFKTELPAGKQFDAGTLGAARTNAMDTNGSQFFITSVAYPSLNDQYTVFGHTADQTSLDIVNKIDAVATDRNDKPLQDVKITGFKIIK